MNVGRSVPRPTATEMTSGFVASATRMSDENVADCARCPFAVAYVVCHARISLSGFDVG